MSPYRADLEAAQRRIDALESEVAEKAEQIEKLQAAVEGRDKQLEKLRAKFDGAAARPWRARLFGPVAVGGTVALVVAIFVIRFRPSEARLPAETSREARTVETAEAGFVALNSADTFADPVDPPARQLRDEQLAEAPDAAAGSKVSRLRTIRLLQERVVRGSATEGELLMLRHLCLDAGLTLCALDAHRDLRRMRGEGFYDELAYRQELELKVYGGDGTESDVRMLRAICSDQGDIPCRDRATQMLKRMKGQNE